MPVLKKCYYEVLGVERNATDDDIKKSFRKLALQLHPDKNLDRHEEAKEEFQVLQQAYEVLSVPQERSWYDLHRLAVLRGGIHEDFEDDSIDIMSYCSSSCYKGFADDDEGFYAVYRKLFEKLAAEEIEAGLEDSDEDIPSFGDNLSTYEEDVGPFYAYWESFCTRKNFAWYDEHDTRHAECRRHSRLMDKSNKKLRTEYKKDWNQRVRALVDFVKRKDKRVQARKVEQEARLKEKEAALAKKIAEEKAQRQKERKKILESIKNGQPVSSQDKEQLKDMEAWMAGEFGEANDIESDEEDCLYCEVCNKSFRTDKAFMNHEKSKKHLRQVQILREQMEEEDENFEEQDTEENDMNVTIEDDITEEEEETAENGVMLNDILDKVQKSEETSQNHLESSSTREVSPSPEEAAEDEETEEDGEEMMLQNFIKIKLNKSDLSNLDERVSPSEAPSILEEEFTLLTKATTPETNEVELQTKKKRRRATKDPKSTPVPKEGDRDPHPRENSGHPPHLPACTGCRKPFDNKNQLFKHLKQYPEHAALKGHNSGKTAVDSRTSSSKKGKNRK